MNDWPPVLGLPLWAWLFALPLLMVAAAAVAPDAMGRVLRPLRRPLDALYDAAGAVAAVFMVTILVLIVAQMIARWAGVTFPGSTEYAGYAMAATSFFALAHALRRGAHIRVSIALTYAAPRARLWIDAGAMIVAACVATYFARFAVKANILSEMINDRTQGQDFVPETLLAVLAMPVTPPSEWGALWADADGWVYTPLWVPQLPMSIGAVLLAVCLWDYLLRLVTDRETRIVAETVE